jgi:hypothetical protein
MGQSFAANVGAYNRRSSIFNLPPREMTIDWLRSYRRKKLCNSDKATWRHHMVVNKGRELLCAKSLNTQTKMLVSYDASSLQERFLCQQRSSNREFQARNFIFCIAISYLKMPASASEEDAISNTPKTVGALDTPDAVKKPNNKHPHNWRRADVLAFLVANKDRYDIDDKHIKVIEKNEVTGRGLLQLSLKDLSDAPYNLPDGAARGIVALVNGVKRKFFLLTEIRISAPICIIENIARFWLFST